MNLIFRDIYSKSKYFHIIALIAKFRNKFYKPNILYELSIRKALTDQDLKKNHEKISSTEGEM